MSHTVSCSSLSSDPKELIKTWITIPLIGGIVISLVYDFDELMAGEYKEYLQSVLASFSFWTLLANGNDIIVYFIDKRWTWLEHPVKRAIMGILGLLTYSPLASLFVLYFFIEYVIGVNFLEVVEQQGLLRLLSIPMGITVFIALWQHGRAFLFEWREAAIDVEKLKTENLKSKFESLKSQVNPHFLFNSLNALTSLVYADQGKAVQFIQKLSDVYRYVLDHQNDEVVPLRTEVEFLKSYVYLNKIRFGDNFEVNYTNLDEFKPNDSVPPVTLQMLIENCIKHNEISKQNKLHVNIERIGDLVIVENNINPIPQAKQDSSGLGLSNIVSRYEILSDQKVEVVPGESIFKVVIPILSFES